MNRNIFIIVLLLVLLGCGSSRSSFKSINVSSYYIFSKEFEIPNSIHFSDLKDRCTPSNQDVERSEELIAKQLKTINTHLVDQGIKGCPVIHDNLNKYKRQYIGYKDNNGDKIMWINFFIAKDKESVKNMKRQVIIVLDGCSQYWNVKINLDRDRVYDLHINGIS